MRLYRIDLQAYFRKMHGITGVEGLDVSLIQPDKTWTLAPKDYAKYKPFEQEVEIPFEGNEAGAYVVTIGDDDLESTVLVLRSDLEVVVKSSRRDRLCDRQGHGATHARQGGHLSDADFWCRSIWADDHHGDPGSGVRR